MTVDPLKRLAETATRATPQEHAVLSDLFDQEIARLMRARRRQLRLSRREYCERTGLNHAHLVCMEIRGARPQIADVYASAKILKPANEDGAWRLAAELMRQAATNLLAAAQPIEQAA